MPDGSLVAFPEAQSDWARVDAMTDEEIEANAWSDPDGAPESAEEIAALWADYLRETRQNLGLSQAHFAEKFRIPLGTLRDWERGASMPDASARTLLRVIAKEPEAVLRALAS
jgi:putative transcriptional regulator